MLPCILSATVGWLWELLQFANIVSGTADIIDCVMYLFGAATAFAVIKVKERFEK